MNRRGPIAASALLVVLILEALREVRAIGESARDASALSRVAELARVTMYPDTDHFLGNYPRPFEAQAHQALDAAYEVARKSVGSTDGLFFRGSAREVREMFLTAERQRTLAATPRGNWISYMAEVARARSDFEAAKGRFDLEHSALVPDSGEDEISKRVTLRAEPITAAIARGKTDLERLEARAAAEARVAKEVQARALAEADEKVRAEQLAADNERQRDRGPDRNVLPGDFLWEWKDGGLPGQVNRVNARAIGLTGRRLILLYGNQTRWRMYNVHMSVDNPEVEDTDNPRIEDTTVELLPDDGVEITIPTNSLDFVPPKAKPKFSGTFIPPKSTR